MTEIQFEEKGHRYTKDGTPRIAVTRVLSECGLVQFPASALPFIEAAGLRGKKVHAACDLYDMGCLDDEVTAGIEGYVKSYIKWREEQAFDEYLFSELIVHDTVVAGTVDRGWDSLREDGGIVIADLKTSDTMYVSYPIQLAAYDALISRHYSVSRERVIIKLHKDGRKATEKWVSMENEYTGKKRIWNHEYGSEVWEWCRNLIALRIEQGLLEV